jgi:putative phage-type endonuclease
MESPHYEPLCHSNDPNWLELRKSGIGASEISAVLGLNPWMSALQLWALKTGKMEASAEESERMWWGKELEPSVLKRYRINTDRWAVPFGFLLKSKEFPWALATPDGFTCENNDAPLNEDAWPLQIKTTSEYNADKWGDGPPDYILVQVQHEMLVTGAVRATLACLVGGQKLIWIDVERDETWINKIKYHGEKFWRLVQDSQPPEPDGSLSSREALAALYPTADSAKMIEMPADLRDLTDQIAELNGQSKIILDALNLRKNRLKAALGDAEKGYWPDGTAVLWKTVNKSEYVVRAQSYRELRISNSKKGK